MDKETSNNLSASCPGTQTNDFTFLCNGQEYQIPKDKLLAVSPVFKERIKQNPKMSLMELPRQYSNIMQKFQEYLLAFVCTVDGADSKLFDQLLGELGVEFSTRPKMKWSGPDKILSTILQNAADLNMEEEIIRALLE